MSCKKAVPSGVVGYKTARACDSCVKKRARWYCAADDAFLCQACDNSVHSANSLARRHTRVRLKTASSSPSSSSSWSRDKPAPTWHRGFTRKARTPRSNGKSKTTNSDHVPHVEATRDPMFPVVPEIFGDETTTTSHEESDEQLLYRVPILDPLVAELCSAAAATTTSGNSSDAVVMNESKVVSASENCEGDLIAQGFLPTEMDLAEFAADVESLLGRGLENECDFGIEGLGFVDCEEKEFSGSGRVKVEEDDEEEEEDQEQEAKHGNFKACWAESSMEMDMMRPEPFELNFEDYDESPASCGENEEDQKVDVSLAAQHEASKAKNGEEDMKKSKKKKKKILLRLDYEAVITEWASQGSPWTTGDRPDFDPDTCWPNCMGTFDTQLHHHHHYMDLSGLVGGNPAALADGGREARVSRYREKRRNRLFSKKIRYEVRKLNAEKRPRMKGRFVKRASFPTVK